MEERIHVELEAVFREAPLPMPLRNFEDNSRDEFTERMAQTARPGEGLGVNVCLRAEQHKKATIRSDYACEACERGRRFCCRVSEEILVIVPLRPRIRKGERSEEAFWRLSL